MGARLELDRLSYRYPGADDCAVADLSLAVEPGEIIALLGPSGCGKTTTLKLIAGLLESEGDVRLDGRSLRSVPPERRHIAMVFQKGLLFEHMDVEANVGFGLRMRRTLKSQIAPRVHRALDQVQMSDFARRRPLELSGGEQQRVALARALVTEPRVLLLDEPLSALDASLRDDMRELLLHLQRDGGHTTVFVTHDQQEAVRLGDRIGLMFAGRLSMYDEPEAFFERPPTRKIAEFFGATNFLEGEYADGVLRTAIGELKLAARVTPGRRTVVIRPESIRLGNGDNAFSARVLECRYLGTGMQYRFAIGSQTVVARLPADVTLTAGETVALQLPPAALWPID
ncbi:MAG: ABC transporter ATP-binding protein [Gammaproteobacteria bacterium]|nr:ABC transporter ATP-binding protein [Gammaproteobacteria bacterium]